MESSNAAIILLASAILFSLIIERLLEVIKAGYDYLESKNNWVEYWNKRAIKLQRRLNNKTLNPKDNGLYYSTVLGLVGSTSRVGQVTPEISGSKVKGLSLKFIFKFLGVSVGILVAFMMQINIFDLIENLVNDSESDNGFIVLSKINWPWLELVVSGIVIGLGSTPIHKIITALDKRSR